MAIATAKLTISLPKDLVALTDKIAEERGVTRSKFVSTCLEEVARKHFRKEMEDGYRAMAEENRQIAKMSFKAQRKIVPAWE